jgi:hypothetical protein
MKYLHEVLEEWFEKLVNEARDTEWGKSIITGLSKLRMISGSKFLLVKTMI